MITLICPHCGHTIEVTNIVVQDSLHGQDKEESIYKTRLEMAEDNAKPQEERQWIVIMYDSKLDRYIVEKKV